MKQTFLVLFYFLSLKLFAQVNFSNDTLLIVKPTIEIGKEYFYNVEENTEMRFEIFKRFTTKYTSLISIKLLDTAKGYWLKYKVHNVKSVSNYFLFDPILDSLEIGIELNFIMSKIGWLTDSANYFSTKIRILKKLDSIISNRVFSVADYRNLVAVKNNLVKLEGLQSFMLPLIAFNDIYFRPTFTKKLKFYNSNESDIIGTKGVQGLLRQQIIKINPPQNTAQVSIKFDANKYEAAQRVAADFKAGLLEVEGKINYFIPDVMTKTSDYKYTVSLKTCLPEKVEIKKFAKFVTKTKINFKMILVH